MITSKQQAYALYEAGLFGNKLRTWPSLDAYLKDPSPGLVCLRYAGAQAGGFTGYYLTPVDVEATLADWKNRGCDFSRVKINEAAPDHRLTIQGEFCEDEATGYSLFYSTEKLPMRKAMQVGRSLRGPSAKLILRQYLSPSSYEDMMVLLDQYPGHVIEFSSYEVNLGTIPGRNTLVWEVRGGY